MRKSLVFLLFCIGITCFSQELNCNVVVNAQQTGNENFPIFKTLEKQLTEFINNTKWTKKTFASQERIECSMVINVTEYSGENFQGVMVSWADSLQPSKSEACQHWLRIGPCHLSHGQG